MCATANVPAKWVPDDSVLFHDGTGMPADAVFPVAPPASIGQVVSAYTPYYCGQGPLTFKQRIAYAVGFGVLGSLAGAAYEFFSGPIAKANFPLTMSIGFGLGALFCLVFSGWNAQINFVGTEGFADFELDPKTFAIKNSKVVRFADYVSVQSRHMASNQGLSVTLMLFAEDHLGNRTTLLSDVVDTPSNSDLASSVNVGRWRSPEAIRPALYACIGVVASEFYGAKKSRLESDHLDPVARELPIRVQRLHEPLVLQSSTPSCKLQRAK